MSTGNLDFPEGTALVLGGSGGVGSAIAAEVASRKISVCITYQSNSERAEELADGIRSSGGVVSTAQVSLQDIESLNRCVKDITNRGRLHSVFIATGYDIPQVSIADLTPELWQRVLRADAEGVFNAIYTTLPTFGPGVVVAMCTSVQQAYFATLLWIFFQWLQKLPLRRSLKASLKKKARIIFGTTVLRSA